MDRPKGLQQRVKKLWYIYIITVDCTLTALFFGSVFILVVHDILLAGNPELFSWGGELWDLFYQLCLAFAVSYIFYLIVVHVKRQHEKEILRPFLYARTLNVAGQARALIGDLNKASEHNFDGEFPSDRADIERMCAAINPLSAAPLVISISPRAYANWYQLMDYYNQRTVKFMESVYTATPFLEPEHLRLLMDLENDLHFTVVKHMAVESPSNTDLLFHASTLHSYFMKARRLQE